MQTFLFVNSCMFLFAFSRKMSSFLMRSFFLPFSPFCGKLCLITTGKNLFCNVNIVKNVTKQVSAPVMLPSPNFQIYAQQSTSSSFLSFSHPPPKEISPQTVIIFSRELFSETNSFLNKCSRYRIFWKYLFGDLELGPQVYEHTLAQGINATPRVFSTKTQDFTPMVLKSLVDVHLLSIGSL